MTTQVVIDDETTERLKEAAASERISFNEALSRAIRVGVARLSLDVDQKPYRVKPHNFGDALENPKEILAQLQEDEDLDKMRRSRG